MKNSTTSIRTAASKLGLRTLMLSIAFITILSTFTSCTVEEIAAYEAYTNGTAVDGDPLPQLPPTTPTTPPRK